MKYISDISLFLFLHGIRGAEGFDLGFHLFFYFPVGGLSLPFWPELFFSYFFPSCFSNLYISQICQRLRFESSSALPPLCSLSRSTHPYCRTRLLDVMWQSLLYQCYVLRNVTSCPLLPVGLMDGTK